MSVALNCTAPADPCLEDSFVRYCKGHLPVASPHCSVSNSTKKIIPSTRWVP